MCGMRLLLVPLSSILGGRSCLISGRLAWAAPAQGPGREGAVVPWSHAVCEWGAGLLWGDSPSSSSLWVGVRQESTH